MYKVVCCYTDEVILETNNKKEAISKLKKLELREYHKYLDYIEDFTEDYTPDDGIPAEYYPTYYITIEGSDKVFSIENYIVLEKSNEFK